MSNLEMKYFVLRPKGNDEHAIASRVAMQAYAQWIAQTDPDLALDIIQWEENEQELAGKRGGV